MGSLEVYQLFELFDLDEAIEHEHPVIFADLYLGLQEVRLFLFFVVIYLLDNGQQLDYFFENIDVL